MSLRLVAKAQISHTTPVAESTLLVPTPDFL
jgi:hypothetical protein